MKIKKLLSTIAALAIAASSFAGLGITANAAAEEVDFIGTSTTLETFDSYDGTGWTSTAASFSTAASENAHFGIVSIEEIAKPEIGAATADSSVPTYVAGSALDTQVRGKTTATTTYTLAEPVTNGKFYFNADLYAHATFTQKGSVISLINSNGETVATLTTDYSTASPITLKGSADSLKSTGAINIRDGQAGIGFGFGIVVDLDAATVSGTADYTNVSNSNVRVSENLANGEATTVSIAEGTDIASFTLTYTGNANSTNYGWAFDNMQVYAMTDKSVATYDYTINYMTDTADDTTIVKTVTDTAEAGKKIATESVIVGDDSGRYYITADEAPTLTIVADEDNILNIEVRAAENFDMKAVASTDAETVFSTATVLEGDTFTYEYPKYLTDNNNGVIASCEASTYSVTETPTGSKTIEVPYTDYEGTAYFVEAEDVLSGTIYSDGRLSNGNGVRSIVGANMLTIPDDGIYTITAKACSNNTNKEETLYIYKNSVAEENLIGSYNIDVSINYIGEFTKTNVTLNANDTIYVCDATGYTILDYIFVEKTADVPVISSVATVAPEGMEITAPETVTDAADSETTAAYADLTDGKVVTTVYVKVDNATDGVAPVVTFNEFEDPAQATYFTTADANGYFVYQIIADTAVTVKSVTYTGAADYTAE